MSFQSLGKVLNSVQGKYPSQEQQRFQQVLQSWVEIVGPIVAAQTRPTSTYRDVLNVSTSSAAWAQNLVFERQRILAKLNSVLSRQLVDIRFSPHQWQTESTSAVAGQHQVDLWQAHPSRISETIQNSAKPEPADAIAAFQHWEASVKSRSRQLPLCPECHCPTPNGELQRWGTCSLCAAKHWWNRQVK